jgi:chemotaxis protein CheY-P-specific phosphatase CheC
MSTAGLSGDQWLNAALASAEELATSALGFEGIQVTGRRWRSTGHFGAYIPLITEEESLHVGVVAGKDACRSLTRSLLGMEEDEDDPTDADIADAVGEIANITAGGIQRRMADYCPSSQLGLPIFIHGDIEPTSKMETAVARVQMGTITIEIVILRQCRN